MNPESAREPDDASIASLPAISPEVADLAVQVVQQMYSGPVPLPAHVTELNKIEPGLGTKLVEDYLRQRDHDRQMERERENNNLRVFNSELRYSAGGLLLGFAAFVFLVGLAGWFALHGLPIMAALFLAAPLVGVVGVFVRGRDRSPKPRK